MIKLGVDSKEFNPLADLQIVDTKDSDTYYDRVSDKNYKIPNNGYSSSIRKGELILKYNYESRELEVWDEVDIIYSEGFEPSVFISNPEKCIKKILKF